MEWWGGACNKIGSSWPHREVCCDSNSILGPWHPACGKYRLTQGLSYWISVCFCFCFWVFFFSWLDFVYSFPAKILCTLETLKLKAQVALLPFEMRILKKKQTNKCRCVFPALLLLGSVGISSWVCPTGFLWGWGPWGQLSSPSWAHQELQINFSLYHVSPVKCSLYPLAVSKGSSAGSMYALGKGLAPHAVHTVFLTAKHGSMQQNLRQWEGCFGEQAPEVADCWIGMAGWRKECSAPISWRNLPLLRGSWSADGWAAALGSLGVYNFSDCSGRWYPCWGGAPP